MLVVTRMLPMPTIGDTMPPIKKPIAPTIAAAAPIHTRPASIAIVDAEVKIKPSEKRDSHTKHSYGEAQLHH